METVKRLNPEWVNYAVYKMRGCCACKHQTLKDCNDGRVHSICSNDGSIVDDDELTAYYSAL